METDNSGETYTVVVNHEEQYSIWPAHKDIPLGWQEVGTRGTKEECLAHIEQVWTDRAEIPGYRITQQPALLRHFTCHLEPVAGSRARPGSSRTARPAARSGH